MTRHMAAATAAVMAMLMTIALPAGTAGTESYETWQTGQEQKFKRFTQKADREFYDFLQRQWQEFQVMAGAPEDQTPKPRIIPRAPRKPVISGPAVHEPPRSIPSREPPVKPRTPGPPEPLPGPEAVPEPPLPKETVSFSFFGQDYRFPAPGSLTRVSLRGCNRQGVAAFWKDFVTADTTPLLARLRYYRRAHRMNDWAYLLLVQKLGDRLFADTNLSRLFCWAVMLKSGYDVRVGFAGDAVHLLYPATDRLYGVPYFSLERKRYYLYSGSASRITTYKADYSRAQTDLDIFLHERPILKEERRTRALHFVFRGRNYRLTATYNPLLVKLMDTLPQFSLAKYFSADTGQMVRSDLVSSLRKAMQDLPDEPVVRVNFLLRFVQRAFAYKTDTEQFSREKYLFPEEMLYYPYSDCEDRCILFAGLVQALTGLDLVVLDYPGHVATAVHVPGEVHGDYVLQDGKKYYMADPTYLNADLGMTMPAFRGVSPVVLPVG